MTLSIRLSPKLFDLLQHCELRCTAGCCGWGAFDLSDRWLKQWCNFRDSTTIAATRTDIARIIEMLADREPDTEIEIERFFQPTVSSAIERLELIDRVLASCLSLDI